MTVSERLTSPSGQFWLELVPTEGDEYGDGWARLEIGEPPAGVAFASKARWPTRFRLRAAWDESDRAWVDSGDVGVSVFVHEDGAWVRYLWARAPGGSAVHDVETGEVLAYMQAPPPPELTEPDGNR